MTQDREQTPLDHRLLATFAKEAETADPIDWSGVDIDRSAAYEIMASQIAEMFRDYEMQGIGRDPQMAIALSTIVKLSVENFVLNQRLLSAGLIQPEP
ncbi:MAG: hypothetical protein KDK03_08285 [Rhodobacteraceae bacterium]|uniref:hypothetical protein n=1 Tax=Amaricoccus sp. B4 TaxID=3368557 RepID=UPI000DACF70F|nr:hypothetical protein [Paracoccaceae bacterium]